MTRFFEIFIGLRYMRARRRNHFISFISVTSLVGIALGVMALITVLSVMNGFQRTLRNRILGVISDVTISGPRHHLADWRKAAHVALREKGVIAAAPYVRGEALLVHGRYSSGALVRGVVPDKEKAVSDIATHIVQGRLAALRPGSFGIVLGRYLAWRLGATVGSHVLLVAPGGMVTPAGFLPRLRSFRVVGVFDVGMYEYDAGLAVINMKDAQALYRMGGDVSGVRLKLANIDRAPAVRRALQARLPAYDVVRDWSEKHANFFRALKIEKTVMFVILLLIVAVAAFNIVATLVMVVTDKRADIAILRTLGASPASVLAIFLVQGTLIGLLGTAIGVVAGVVLSLNVTTIVPFIEHVFHTHFLSANVYYISELPSHLRWQDVAHVAAASFLMSFLATLYPAWRASKTQPAEALRYE
ncbi:lipoprotein-releasing ABC transporter permease subunit [Acidiferrobacter sp.]|jgi:lipoprotein-releasing system permease protein|uniref:lipoprotein-releasing ABC transporter permease subunit n=1 Tax=Acidiferrobacter sp. TaxID=1872107 RepID=UPI00260931CB|nr:lipoprotein-releasing ABC transporter permease subunit [Acidiferrobacter sp.]